MKDKSRSSAALVTKALTVCKDVALTKRKVGKHVVSHSTETVPVSVQTT